MIVLLPYLVPKGYRGITLFPFIILKHQKDKENSVVVNHERIHLRQQLELLVVLFYLWYVVEFVVRWCRLKHWHSAYKAISFEKEAYTYETNLNYLKNRRFWEFIRYF